MAKRHGARRLLFEPESKVHIVMTARLISRQFKRLENVRVCPKALQGLRTVGYSNMIGGGKHLHSLSWRMGNH